MIPKKLAYIFFVFILLLSTFASYTIFVGAKNNLYSPLSVKYQKSTGTEQIAEPTESNEPKTEECPINGEMLTKTQKQKWETRRPLGVMIENHKDARPQSGLSSADVIYEAVAEGGVTRFLSIYYCKDTSFVGPVRSARIYFVRLLEGYGQYPLYAHVGGANCDKETGSGCGNGAPADALGTIRKLGWEGYNDLNQFGVPFPTYWRDYERLSNRVTEHTVYSSTEKLWKYAKDKRKLTEVDEDGKKWDSTFKPWLFKDDATQSSRGKVSKIEFGFWKANVSDYSVSWNYSPSRNSYLRNNGGKPHIDKNTNKTIETKNVVIVYADESPANDGYDGGHMLYKIIGKGDGLLFQDGKAIKVTWQKLDAEDQIRFYDENNKEVSFVRGQIFVEIIPTGNKVTY
jgi:hypothetical protein